MRRINCNQLYDLTQTFKTIMMTTTLRLRNDLGLYCVACGVKLYSLTHSQPLSVSISKKWWHCFGLCCFGLLSNIVFGLYLKERRLPLPIKIRVYLALVQSVLLYASETWTLTSADDKSLEAFHMKCQRRILRISWRQFVRNSEISALTGLPAIDVIRHRRIAVFGHIVRLQAAPQHIKHYSLTSTSHSVVFPIPSEVVSLVAHVADGSIKSETTPARHLPTSGDRPLDAVISDVRRDGPRWLCDDDDDVLRWTWRIAWRTCNGDMTATFNMWAGGEAWI